LDWIATESLFTIFVNNEELTSFSCSPVNLEEMTIGFLFSSGIISKPDEIEILRCCPDSSKASVSLKEDVHFDNKKWKKHHTITSGCGQGILLNLQLPQLKIFKITGSFQISPEYICDLFSDLKHISQSYEKTGCIHFAALIKEGGPSLVREDIGRHNAIDKVIGAGLRLNISMANYILCCSGRISSDMILKGGRAGIPIMLSRGAPTSLAVDIADKLGITLIGFVRGKRFNIYSHPERVAVINKIEMNNSEPDKKSRIAINQESYSIIN